MVENCQIHYVTVVLTNTAAAVRHSVVLFEVVSARIVERFDLVAVDALVM